MRIGLFVTCPTDTMSPETGKALVTVLERLEHQVKILVTPFGHGLGYTTWDYPTIGQAQESGSAGC